MCYCGNDTDTPAYERVMAETSLWLYHRNSVDHCGNIFAASVPILLDECNRKGWLERGDKIVLCGFGAGLSWGTAVMEW